VSLLAPLSIGDLCDRITILRIKSQRIADPFKLSYIGNELAVLEQVWNLVERPVNGELDTFVGQLQAINEAIWRLEDEARTFSLTSPPERALDCLLAITRTNDERAKVKRYINQLMGSELVEMKSHR
jgi:hypothetical protein